MKKIDRTGEVKENLKGLEMKIIEYKNCHDVRVLFTASGETRRTTYLKFKQGKVYPTWKNLTYKKDKFSIPSNFEFQQDIRDFDVDSLLPIIEEEDSGSNLGVALAMAIGSIAIIGIILSLIGWLC